MYSTKQIARIKRLASDDYADANERSALICSVESSAELHQVVLWFNYDGFEIRELAEIIDHPHCSAGTALLIYWGLQPDYIYRQIEKKKTLPPDLQGRLPFLKELERRIFEGVFGGTAIEFSPVSLVGRPLRDDDVYRPGIRLVPEWMKSPIQGEIVDRQNLNDA